TSRRSQRTPTRLQLVLRPDSIRWGDRAQYAYDFFISLMNDPAANYSEIDPQKLNGSSFAGVSTNIVCI
ncbi:MAG TPA: hypothetical protein VFM35_05035, partial [Candidatus Binatia bacterium]|nr:hypothetical protein [Candidatus Binatia bacterium]